MGVEQTGVSPVKDQPQQLATADAFAEALGFARAESDESGEGDRVFSIIAPPEEKKEGIESPDEYFLTVTPGTDPESGSQVEHFALAARWPGDEERRPYAELFEVEGFQTKVVQRAGGGFTVESLKNGGYEEVMDYINMAVLRPSSQPVDEYSPKPREESVEDKDKRIGLEQKEKYFSHEESPEDVAGVAANFQEAFPEYANVDPAKEDDLYIYTEPDESGSAQYIRAYSAKGGFGINFGEATVKTKRDGRRVIDKKKTRNWVSPLYRSEEPDNARPWDFWETGEATEVVRLRFEDLVVNDEFLDMAASWSADENRPNSMRELLSYWVTEDILTDMRLKSLGDPEQIKVPFPRALTDDDLASVTMANLGRESGSLHLRGIGEVSSEDARQAVADRSQLGYLVMRQQFVRLETAISRISQGDFIMPD